MSVKTDLQQLRLPLELGVLFLQLMRLLTNRVLEHLHLGHGDVCVCLLQRPQVVAAVACWCKGHDVKQHMQDVTVSGALSEHSTSR